MSRPRLEAPPSTAEGGQAGSRRRFLSQALGTTLSASLLSALPAPAAAGTDSFLRAFADTLLPPSDIPGAADLGAHLQLLERAAGDAVFADILAAAQRAIDAGSRQMFGAEFAGLTPAQRDEVFARLDPLPDSDMLGWFFRAARADIFFHYYGQAETAGAVGLDGPPQPLGFDDIDRPWSAP